MIFLVFFTFGLVCFGTFFFLPEFRGSSSAADSVYKVYDQIKRAGPELLIPPPPHLESEHKKLGVETQVKPHIVGDREKLKAKIEQDGDLKVLERPDIGPYPKSSSTAKIESNQLDENVGREMEGVLVPRDSNIITVPPALSDHYPDISQGEDKDSVSKERRNKVKEVSDFSELLLNPVFFVNFYATRDPACTAHYPFTLDEISFASVPTKAHAECLLTLAIVSR